jgi:alkanesulfonate monooxygenase SsuD/methylene tetrahydromethanopterin reductase-like flavin-dependent oxidoreductase (luciferase family)
VSVGVGVGWMREEYELQGQDFDTRGKRLNEMIPALRELWRGGWVSWNGEYYQVPELMNEPHPEAPIPILCGGESDAALRRPARMCDGWVGYAYAWNDAVGYVEKLKQLRREYGREDEPFDILLALLEPPTPDLYKRAEDVGITQVMSAAWMGMDLPPGGAERYREPIERFAETVIAKVRR